jgi:hypothetical protein
MNHECAAKYLLKSKVAVPRRAADHASSEIQTTAVGGPPLRRTKEHSLSENPLTACLKVFVTL